MRHRNADQRFAAKYRVDPDSDCWLWTGALRNGRYGSFWGGEHRNGDNRQPIFVQAHRWSYERFRGAIPEGLKVCHRCDIPSCVNPDHLFVGTQRENVLDSIGKGRWVFPVYRGKRAG